MQQRRRKQRGTRLLVCVALLVGTLFIPYAIFALFGSSERSVRASKHSEQFPKPIIRRQSPTVASNVQNRPSVPTEICLAKFNRRPDELEAYLRRLDQHRANIASIASRQVDVTFPEKIVECEASREVKDASSELPRDLTALSVLNFERTRDGKEKGICLHVWEEMEVKKFEAPVIFFCNQSQTFNASYEFHSKDGWESYGNYTTYVTTFTNAYVYRAKTEITRIFDDKRLASQNYKFVPLHTTSGPGPMNLANVSKVVEFDRLFAWVPRTGALSYYHHLVEDIFGTFVHLLELIEKYPDMKILTMFPLPGMRTKYMGEINYVGDKWLDLLKIDKKRIVHFESDPDRVFFAKRMYVPGTPRSKNPSPATLINSRRIVFNRLGGLYEKLSERQGYEPYILVVKRSYQGVDVPKPDKEVRPGDEERDVARAIIGHDHMMERLKKEFPNEQFRVFDAEPSQLETARTFNGAKIIIAPHGAGNSNLVFASADAFLIEIISEFTVPSMANLANVIGIGYFGITPLGSDHMRPMEVDFDEVVSNLKMALYAYDRQTNK